MGLINTLTFDGLKSSDYGVFLAGDGVFDSPARRGEMVTIPGRNGTLFMDEDSFDNIEVTYPAFIGTDARADFSDKLRRLRSDFAARRTYKRLTNTYHPDEFRLGVFHKGVETDPAYYTRAGRFNLVFDCKPQRFLTSGEIPLTFTAKGEITNPTPFASNPLLKVTGNGNFSIGDYQVLVSGNPGTFWIDCEIMEAYIPAAEIYKWTDEQDALMTDEHGFDIEFANGPVYPSNMLKYVVFANHEFPQIVPGMNAIEVDGITELVIVPRWWLL